jgi:ADP-ribose pyrophosphatase YjhB (NUDIX family)
VPTTRFPVLVMVVIERPSDGALLVAESLDPDGLPFQRPLGGHVELGERTEVAIAREVREEIDQGLQDVRRIGVIENIFSWGDESGHEIVFVYRAGFSDPAAYRIEEQVIRDDPEGTRVLWRQPSTLAPPLVPSGVAQLLATEGAA